MSPDIHEPDETEPKMSPDIFSLSKERGADRRAFFRAACGTTKKSRREGGPHDETCGSGSGSALGMTASAALDASGVLTLDSGAGEDSGVLTWSGAGDALGTWGASLGAKAME